MNKVILLSETEKLAKGPMDFAVMMNELSPILLTGVFMPDSEYWDSLLYYSLGAASAYLLIEDDVLSNVHTPAAIQFSQDCEHAGIDYRVHEIDYSDLKNDIKKETRFADLMLLSWVSFHDDYSQLINDGYAKESLHYAECPVLVVPKDPVKVTHIILTYDGSASSVYAIRQFAALFPQLALLDTLLVYVNADADEDIPYKNYIVELAARHFPNLTLHHLDINPKKYFATWLQNQPDSLIVTGAKGRSNLSEIFRKSFISEVLGDVQLPLFVAHHG